MTTTQSAAQFDAFPELYDAYNALRDHLAPTTAEWVRSHLPGGARAVDLGCGPGRFTPLLAERYDEVLAVDISEQLLRLARERQSHANITYQLRNIVDVTPGRDGMFDAVLTVNALHHAGPLGTVLPHLRRLVAPGGWLLLIDLVDPGSWGDRQWHVDHAFAVARAFYDRSGGDPDAAATAIRLLAHPRWLEMRVADPPPGREDYDRAIRSTLPGASHMKKLQPRDLQAALAWQAPASGVGDAT